MVLILSVMTQTRDIQTALETFRQHGGVMRTSQALIRGIHPAALYRLVEDGQLMRLARGLYRLTSSPEFSNPDLAVVAAKAPEAVVCLISALAFHGITTQVPRVVYVAVPRGRYAGLRLHKPESSRVDQSSCACDAVAAHAGIKERLRLKARATGDVTVREC